MDFSNVMMDPANEIGPIDSATTDRENRSDPMQSPRFIAISRTLQRIFGKVVEQPLPERLQDLIDQVERSGLHRK